MGHMPDSGLNETTVRKLYGFYLQEGLKHVKVSKASKVSKVMSYRKISEVWKDLN